MSAAKKSKVKRNEARRKAREEAFKRADVEGDTTEPPSNGHQPIQVSDGDFDRIVVDSDIPVLVDFWASWCGPCRMLAPSLERLATEMAGKLKVVKYNTEKNRRVAGAMGIRSLPSLVLFRDGKVADVQIGAVPYGRLQSWVRRHLEPKRSVLARIFGSSKEDLPETAQ